MKITIIKTTRFIYLFIFGVFLISATNINAQTTTTTDITYVKVEVDGLSCPFCAYGLEKKIKKLKTAKDIKIELEKGELIFAVHKTNEPSKDELITIVKNAGFTAKEITFSTKPFKDKNE